MFRLASVVTWCASMPNRSAKIRPTARRLWLRIGRTVAAGPKSLVGNKGYRRYVSQAGHGGFGIDEAKIAEDARYDGKWVLRTNTELDTTEVALQYKRLWMVEAWFRSCKSLLVMSDPSPL